jgi:hypothetical protein
MEIFDYPGSYSGNLFSGRQGRKADLYSDGRCNFCHFRIGESAAFLDSKEFQEREPFLKARACSQASNIIGTTSIGHPDFLFITI